MLSITAIIRRIGVASDESISYETQHFGANFKRVNANSLRDLTPHPWAGLTVNLTLVGKDAAGNSGESETHSLRLPERIFTHPVAKKIVAARKTLTVNPELNRLGVADYLGRIAWKPSQYNDHKVVFMALHTAVRRLRMQSYVTELDEVQKL